MKTSTSVLAALSMLLVSATLAGVAEAQPGQPPPGYGGGYYAPPPPMGRRGLAIGFGLGIGNMEADSGPIRCDGCDYNPIAVGGDFHIGAMISPNMALLFEAQVTAQQLDAVGAETLNQVMGMGAVQYWFTPMFWIKGGIGGAGLSIAYDDGYDTQSEDLDTGLAVMAAVGYEVMHSQRFAMDLQLRLSSGTYDGLQDELHSAIVSLGFNWFQ